MKSTAIFVLCFLYGTSHAVMNPFVKMMQINNDCLVENKFTMQDFFDFASRLNLPFSNPNYPLYLDCLYNRQGWMEDGKIIYSEIKNQISSGIGEIAAGNVVDACKDLPPGPNDGQTILAFVKCVTKEIKGNKTYYKMWLNRDSY